jgi:phosphate starvation-inducible protein PhoH
MARKSRTKKDRQIIELQEVLYNNIEAKKDGPQKKTWSLHDLKSIKPLTFAQKHMFKSYFEDLNIVASGTAGTGKSYCGIYLALTDFLKPNSKYDRIIIVRSTVQTRSMGFLPGDANEKCEPFEAPYKDIFSDLLGKNDAYEILKEQKKVVFMPTSFIRGLTWDNCIVIVDEVQNLTAHEINSIMTRIGNDCKFILCGDTSQNDLIQNKNDVSGFADALKILAKIESVDIVNFTIHDIVRSKFVREWIAACEG